MDRRLLLTRIVQGFALTGAGFLTYPFLKAWIPSFAEELHLDIDVSELEPGDHQIIQWLGRNVVVLKRDAATINALEQSEDELKDPSSEASLQPPQAVNSHRSLRPEVFVAFTNCTHLGCEVVTDGSAFKCPCHQSDYDSAGRVLEGAAAPRNLDVPNYRYLSRQLIRLEQVEA